MGKGVICNWLNRTSRSVNEPPWRHLPSAQTIRQPGSDKLRMVGVFAADTIIEATANGKSWFEDSTLDCCRAFFVPHHSRSR
jgi:hypothetical protein